MCERCIGQPRQWFDHFEHQCCDQPDGSNAGEIEDCLLGHPAVKLAAVIGVPDETRHEIVKAYIVLETGSTSGWKPGAELVEKLQAHVKTRLAVHEYPRQIAFIDELPMTTTGKIMRRKLREWHLQGVA